VPILAIHDEIVVECDEKDVERAEAWLKTAMIDGMDEVVNGPKADGPRVPIEVEVESGRTWAG
jgi:DNA polymerase I-like protein with 3'-5' exonuclease and polymerase domains